MREHLCQLNMGHFWLPRLRREDKLVFNDDKHIMANRQFELL